MSSERKVFEKQHFKGTGRILISFLGVISLFLLLFFLVDQLEESSVFAEDNSCDRISKNVDKEGLKIITSLLIVKKNWQPESKELERVYFNEKDRKIIATGEIRSEEVKKNLAIKLDPFYIELAGLRKVIPIIKATSFRKGEITELEFECFIEGSCLKVRFPQKPPENLSIEYYIYTDISDQFRMEWDKFRVE